ncbi:MAG: bifunctional adenosylcobinamide kinase/adenosylcobinamide-phosphate guanylyltransferase [Eubacterium sp.]|nr:bifunctional adenosylcobinamide kinase/adenosylcobinamide-phosphate guanylyltransferase [Eubacterium sp.]
MMILVTGASGSGKSAYAEQLAGQLAGTLPGGQAAKYYLATMQIYDEEGLRKVWRHRQMRYGKGFLTIEQPVAVHKALAKMQGENRTVLLECISNLVANEMFSEKKTVLKRQVVETAIHDIRLLKEQTAHLIVVGSNVFDDGIAYDPATMAYMRALAKISRQLAALADQVVEVVAGIPLAVKQ